MTEVTKDQAHAAIEAVQETLRAIGVNEAAMNRVCKYVEQIEEKQTWQPIETAPKDGSPVLVFDGEHYAVGYWAPDIKEWWVSKKMKTTMLGTHWIPLPQPPEREVK